MVILDVDKRKEVRSFFKKFLAWRISPVTSGF